MRVTAAFSRLLALPGVCTFDADRVVVTVALRRWRLVCPHCEHATWFRHDTRPVDSTWRHLDLGVAAGGAGPAAPAALSHPRVHVEGVPFARAGSRFTRDFEDLVGFLATTADKTTICRLVRIDWDTVERIITRVMDDGLDPNRLEDLFEIGVDEVSWRGRHNYITLVSNHHQNKVSGAPRAATPPPLTASSTSWAPSAPRGSPRCRWTCPPATPSPCAGRHTPPQR
jgi:transposase